VWAKKRFRPSEQLCFYLVSCQGFINLPLFLHTAGGTREDGKTALDNAMKNRATMRKNKLDARKIMYPSMVSFFPRDNTAYGAESKTGIEQEAQRRLLTPPGHDP
jgi:hypothetical protein